MLHIDDGASMLQNFLKAYGIQKRGTKLANLPLIDNMYIPIKSYHWPIVDMKQAGRLDHCTSSHCLH